jgi:hypothetical protein
MPNKATEQTNILLEKCNGDNKAVVAYLLGHIGTIETEIGYIQQCLNRGTEPLVNYMTLEERLED